MVKTVVVPTATVSLDYFAQLSNRGIAETPNMSLNCIKRLTLSGPYDELNHKNISFFLLTQPVSLRKGCSVRLRAILYQRSKKKVLTKSIFCVNYDRK